MYSVTDGIFSKSNVYFSVMKAPYTLVLTEMSFCEKNNKRRHSIISKRSKYAEVDSEEDDVDDDSNDYCEYYI